MDSEGGTRVYPLAAAGVPAEPVASCDGAGGTVSVLVRTMHRGRRMPGAYSLHTVAATGPLAERSVKGLWLFEPSTSGNVRILDAGSAVVIVSTQWEQLRVTVAPHTGQARTVTFPLGKGLLRGLVRMTVASLHLWGSDCRSR